jgi:hypothetical protein
MEKIKEKKPIDNIREDLQSVIFSVEKLHKDFEELRELNKSIILKLEEKLNKEYPEPIVSKSWFY